MSPGSDHRALAPPSPRPPCPTTTLGNGEHTYKARLDCLPLPSALPLPFLTLMSALFSIIRSGPDGFSLMPFPYPDLAAALLFPREETWLPDV